MEVLLVSCIFFKASGGAHAWIRIPFPGLEISIQPSEFAKIVSILIIAAYLGDVKKTYPNAKKLLLRPLLFIGIYLLTIVFLQHDFGSMAVNFLISSYYCAFDCLYFKTACFIRLLSGKSSIL